MELHRRARGVCRIGEEFFNESEQYALRHWNGLESPTRPWMVEDWLLNPTDVHVYITHNVTHNRGHNGSHNGIHPPSADCPDAGGEGDTAANTRESCSMAVTVVCGSVDRAAARSDRSRNDQTKDQMTF